MRFGISTHLYHDQQLGREHFAQIAEYGFDRIELFATRSHFDYRDAAAIEALAAWLADAGLTLHSVHAPIMESFGRGDSWGSAFSNAASDAARRVAAVRETEAALQIARRIPFEVLVVHLGVPDTRSGPGENNRAAAAKSVEEICALGAPLGVRVALEVIPNSLSTPAALATMLDRDVDGPAGICLDFGHAFLGGDVPDAIETVAEHLIATHVHDNHRRADDHLVPYAGGIEWDGALMSMQKVGYDGIYLMEVANTGAAADVLQAARRACDRFERTLTDA